MGIKTTRWWHKLTQSHDFCSYRFHSKLFLEVLNTQLEKFGLNGCLKWREIELKEVSTRGVTDGEVRISDIVVNLLTA